jgi:ABC-type lipoprotein export system ATPase subunit
MDMFKRLNEEGTTIVQVTHSENERRLRQPNYSFGRRLDRQ